MFYSQSNVFDIPSFVFPLDKCARFHHHLPYKWQILQKDGTTWGDLLNEEEVEKAYCSPANVLWYKNIHICTNILSGILMGFLITLMLQI